ncbi:MAG: hypothetical protein M3680_28115 [Myxococcota bacterium]|nr:hypothetical protein [Myxococcota bacterium]
MSISSLVGSSLIVLGTGLGVAAAEPATPVRAPIAERLQGQRTLDRAKAVPSQGKRVAQAPVVKVTCEFLEISAATGKDASLDPALKHVERKLAKQPWSFNQYKLLSHLEKSLEKGKTEALTFKSGSGTATLVETVDKSKLRLKITEDHGGKRVVNNTTTLAAGDWLIVGHPVPASKDGHLVAVSCK